MTTYSTTHDGLERVLEGADVLRHSVGPAKGMRIAPTIVLTGMVAAVVVLADRMFGEMFGDGFAREWIALWALSVVAALLLAKAAFALTAWLVRSEHGLVARWRRAADERRFRELAAMDHRVMEEFRIAKSVAEWR